MTGKVQTETVCLSEQQNTRFETGGVSNQLGISILPPFSKCFWIYTSLSLTFLIWLKDVTSASDQPSTAVSTTQFFDSQMKYLDITPLGLGSCELFFTLLKAHKTATELQQS